MTHQRIDVVPVTGSAKEIEHWVQKIAIAVNELMDGKANGFGEVTLTAASTTTTLTDRRIGADSFIVFRPRTANAAAAMDTLWVSARTKGSATLTHDSTADTDRTFEYEVRG